MVPLGDREYIGKEWFNYLIDKGAKFVVRIKEGIHHEAVNNSPGRSQAKMCDKLCQNKKDILMNGHSELTCVVTGCD